jgi:hypothetical protein
MISESALVVEAAEKTISGTSFRALAQTNLENQDHLGRLHESKTGKSVISALSWPSPPRSIFSLFGER